MSEIRRGPTESRPASSGPPDPPAVGFVPSPWVDTQARQPGHHNRKGSRSHQHREPSQTRRRLYVPHTPSPLARRTDRRHPVTAVMADTATRRCTSCGRVKPLTDFAPKVTTRSGIDGVCVVCRDGMARTRAWYRAGCTGKHRYDTNADAAKVASKRTKHGEQTTLRVYHCPACAGWHLTRKTDR